MIFHLSVMNVYANYASPLVCMVRIVPLIRGSVIETEMDDRILLPHVRDIPKSLHAYIRV